LSATDEQALVGALSAEMSVTVDREQLILRAHEIFWNRRWRIPARRSVERIVREAMRRVEAMDIEALRSVLQPAEMEHLYERLVETQVDGVSALEWIRRPPSKRGAKSRALAMSKLEYLRTTFNSIAYRAIPIPASDCARTPGAYTAAVWIMLSNSWSQVERSRWFLTHYAGTPGRSRRADARDGDCTPVATGTGAGHEPCAYRDVGSQ
jgi:hypothetical protein